MLKVSSLYLVKTTYSFLLTVLSILLSFNYPFYPIQLTLIGSLCVGLPSFILALEPNNEKVDKDNLKKVFAYSIPSGITVCINVLLLLLVTKIFHLNIENYKMALVASTGIINLIIINNISIRKLRENRAPKARREKQAARLVLTSRAAMLMGEGKKAALVLHYICPIMEFV